MRPISRILFFLAFAFVVASVPSAGAEGRSQKYRKLDAGERARSIERALEVASPELSRRASRAPGASFRSEVVLVERHRFAKGADSSRRLADVYIYDYDQDQLCRAVIDLDTDRIESLDVGEGVQLPLTASEVARATRLAFEHPEFGAQLRADYEQVMGVPLVAIEEMEVSGFTYRAESMADGPDRESRVCGKRRCAQLLVRTPDGVVLDLPIVDLSRNRLLDSREFGLNGAERLRRRRAIEAERARTNRNTGHTHHESESGGGHAH